MAGESVARILGEREFYGLAFGLDAATLEPRPDTELLVDLALAALPAGGRLLDLGTGTGCILLALLSELPAASGLGVDIQPDAVATARLNARQLGLERRAEFREGDWGAGIAERFGLVVSNPPYIPEGDIPGLDPEVRLHDPVAALAGGEDGLAAYRVLARQLPDLLAPGGAFALEVGAGQAESVAGLMAAQGLSDIQVRADLGGIGRCVHGMAPAQG